MSYQLPGGFLKNICMFAFFVADLKKAKLGAWRRKGCIINTCNQSPVSLISLIQRPFISVYPFIFHLHLILGKTSKWWKDFITWGKETLSPILGTFCLRNEAISKIEIEHCFFLFRLLLIWMVLILYPAKAIIMSYTGWVVKTIHFNIYNRF